MCESLSDDLLERRYSHASTGYSSGKQVEKYPFFSLQQALLKRGSRKCLRFLASGAIVCGWQLQGPWVPSGIETQALGQDTKNSAMLQGPWVPSGIETRTMSHQCRIHFKLQGPWVPSGIETQKRLFSLSFSLVGYKAPGSRLGLKPRTSERSVPARFRLQGPWVPSGIET